MSSLEAGKQMTEEGRKQWLSQHLSRGKAFERCESVYNWLVSHRMVAKVRSQRPWVEPFSIKNTPDEKSGNDVISSLEALNLLIFIVNLRRDNPSWEMNVNFDEIRHELRSDAYEIVCSFDKNMLKSSVLGNEERVKSLLELILKEEQGSDTFERAYAEVLNTSQGKAPYCGSPYLEDKEIIAKINYTDSAATYLNFLSKLYPIVSDDDDYDVSFQSMLVKHIVDTVHWLKNNAREQEEGGIGWGWSGFTNEKEELSMLYCLDADKCVAQTYFTSRVIDSFVNLLELLAANQGQIEPELLGLKSEVEELIYKGIEGLVYNNKIGDGWVDFIPYNPTVGSSSKASEIAPFEYNEYTPSLLHTALVIKTVCFVLLKAPSLKLDCEYIEEVERAIKWVVKTLSNTPMSNLKDKPYKHVLSRFADGNELYVIDETGLYQIFGAVAAFSKVIGSKLNIDYQVSELSDHESIPYYEMAEYILNDLVDLMYEKGGFPPTGSFAKSDVKKLPGIRATKIAIEAFADFGLKQMVPSVDAVIDKHLLEARNNILHELVKEYGALETQGIRVAWGLIENSEAEISK